MLYFSLTALFFFNFSSTVIVFRLDIWNLAVPPDSGRENNASASAALYYIAVQGGRVMAWLTLNKIHVL